MTSPADFRARLEALLGPVHTADRAAEALGCSSRAVEYWFAGTRPDGRSATPPRWVIRHLETLERIRELETVIVDLSALIAKPLPN